MSDLEWELGWEVEELRKENSALHEQLAKCVERMLELEGEVAHYKQWLKERTSELTELVKKGR